MYKKSRLRCNLLFTFRGRILETKGDIFRVRKFRW